VTNPAWQSVDDYFGALFIGPDAALDAALAGSAAAGLPAIAVSPLQGKQLYLLARAIGARSILEIGTLGGYSTIWLARALSHGGRVITLELKPEHAAVAQENITRAGLADRVDLRVGPALDTLARLVRDGAGPFDLVFIDADKQAMAEYFSWSLRLSRPGTLIIGDNVVRDGKVTEGESTDSLVQGVRRFNAAVAAEPLVTATAVQTVGAKGYDGFAMVLVNDPVAR
jgi:predicted O-methyltransferase YrrM